MCRPPRDQEEFQRREFAEEQRKLEMKKKLMEEESKLREAELSKQKDLQEKMMLLKRESMEKKKELMRQQAELSESSVASHVSKSGRVRDWITSQQQVQGDNTENIQQRIPYPTPHIANEASLERDGSLLTARRQLSNLSLHDDDRHTTKPEIPTAYMQIAARQVTGRDLPAFSGNPEDWPMFIRTYEETTAACGFSDVENLEYPTLLKLSKCALADQSLSSVRRRVAAPKPERLDTLIDFGLAVENLVVHLQAAKQENHLTNPVLLQELVTKLPVQLRWDWARYKILQQDATLATFGDFMNELIQAASEVSFDLPVSLSARAEKPKDREKVFIHTHDAPDMESKASDAIKKTQKPCIVCSAIGHRVAECEEFKAKCVNDRMQIVRQHNLCRTCLNFHQKWPCRTWHGCNIEGCRERHHFLLHPTTTSHFSSNHSTIISASSDSYPYFRILPVLVSMGNKRQVIYAFIDEGSSSTLLDQSVAEQLGLDGPAQPLTLQWTANVERQESRSKKVNFQISGTGKADTFQITAAHTVERLLLPKQSLPYGGLTNKYPHLRGLPIADYTYAEPKILIGLDNLSLCVPLKVREGRMNDPIAAKCRLGWTIYGYSACASGPTVSVNFHVAAAPDADHELNEQLKDFVSLDRSLTTLAFEMPESDADRRARMLLEKTTRKVSDRFETGLLWKSNNIEFPNSLPMAIRRLDFQKKKKIR